MPASGQCLLELAQGPRAAQQMAQDAQARRVPERGQDRGGGVQIGVEDIGRGVLELPDDLAGARRAHPAAVGQASGDTVSRERGARVAGEPLEQPEPLVAERRSLFCV